MTSQAKPDIVSIADLMVESDPILSSEDDVNIGIRALSESCCDSLAVVDQDGVYFGMFGVTESIQASFPGYLWEMSSPDILGRALDPKLIRGSSGRRIADLADRRTYCVDVGGSLANLACLFVRHQVTVLPVLDQGALSGLVSRQALLDQVLLPNSAHRNIQ